MTRISSANAAMTGNNLLNCIMILLLLRFMLTPVYNRTV